MAKAHDNNNIIVVFDLNSKLRFLLTCTKERPFWSQGCSRSSQRSPMAWNNCSWWGGGVGDLFFQQTGSNLIIRQSGGVGGQSYEYDNTTDQVSH